MTKHPFRARYCVDWDDTCVAERREDGSLYWPQMGPWLPGAPDALRWFSKRGLTVVYSLRTHLYEMDDCTPRDPDTVADQHRMIRAMLDSERLFDVLIYPSDRGKPPAEFYVDDKAVRFQGNWDDAIREVAEREL